jgi:hypothetical protein
MGRSSIARRHQQTRLSDGVFQRDALTSHINCPTRLFDKTLASSSPMEM